MTIDRPAAVAPFPFLTSWGGELPARHAHLPELMSSTNSVLTAQVSILQRFFNSSSTRRQNKLGCLPNGKSCQPSLIFASKAGAYLRVSQFNCGLLGSIS